MQTELAIVILAIILTSNGLIPKPSSIEYTEELFIIPKQFKYTSNSPQCLTLNDAIKRFLDSLQQRQPVHSFMYANASLLNELNIKILKTCNESTEKIRPSTNNNESYYLRIHDRKILIAAEEVWGALHGLTTVIQLIKSNTDNNQHYLQGVEIADSPRFGFRSYLIDTSRHYISVFKIKQFIEAMAFAKMNILHWHIVDDPSFPFVSSTFTNLSQKGAFDPEMAIYTSTNVALIIEYARQRGIRVMPEFDTPGHTQSWGKGYPNLLTECFSEYSGTFGPIDPTKNETYSFLKKLFAEIVDTFPESMLHLGGDEVDFSCWGSNPEITKFMKKMDFGTNYASLEAYYMKRLINDIKSLESSNRQIHPIVWQEVFDNNVSLSSDVMVHVWISVLWKYEIERIAKSGHDVIFSSCWYLSDISKWEDWIRFYDCDPGTFTTNVSLQAKLKGGGAAMWGEFVDDVNFIQRSWPRGAAVAERLWSPSSASSVVEFRPRLQDFRCRLLEKTIPAEPVTSSHYCKMK